MKLIDNWRQCWKMASIRVYALIGLMPDIYNAIAAYGWLDQIPDPAMWVIRVMVAAGIASRIIKQSGLEVKNG